MKTFKERAKELADACVFVKRNNVYETLAKEFGIGKRTAGDRFKSIFGKCVRDYIYDNTIPSKEKMIDAFVKSETYEEMIAISGIRHYQIYVSVANMYFHETNYGKIKLSLAAKSTVKGYVVTRADNESILISQLFGDGHFERGNSIKIEHCEKQYEYLKFKISLLNKAFPETNGFEAIRKRNIFDKRTSKKYVSYSYRTSPCLAKQIQRVESRTIDENVNLMTPFGVMLYFLDDGSLTYSEKYKTCSLSFASKNEELKECLIKYFRTYGYEFHRHETYIQLQSKIEIVKFINDFLMPFENIIPDCMKYKICYKDIVGDLH